MGLIFATIWWLSSWTAVNSAYAEQYAKSDAIPGKPAEVRNLQTIPYSPYVYSQENSLWCTAFSVRSALQQKLCRSSRICDESNQLSLRSVIASQIELEKYDLVTWKSGVSPFDLLEKVVNGHKMIKDSCAPSTDFLSFQTALRPDRTDKDWGGGPLADYADPLEKMRDFFNAFKSRQKNAPGNDFATCGAVAKTLALRPGRVIPPRFAHDLCVAAIQSSNTKQFLLMALEPPRCKNDRLDLPSGIQNSDFVVNVEEIKKRLQANIQAGRATIVALCQDDLVDEPSIANKCKWEHSTVVADSRQVKDHLEYRLLDPDFKSYNLPKDADNGVWVDGDLVLNDIVKEARITSSGRNLTQFTEFAKKSEFANLIWLGDLPRP